MPARSTLLGGLSGLAVWLITILLTKLGVSVPQEAVGGLVTVATALVVHYVPDSLQDQAKALDVDVKSLAKWLPEAKYPDENRHPNS